MVENLYIYNLRERWLFIEVIPVKVETSKRYAINERTRGMYRSYIPKEWVDCEKVINIEYGYDRCVILTTQDDERAREIFGEYICTIRNHEEERHQKECSRISGMQDSLSKIILKGE